MRCQRRHLILLCPLLLATLLTHSQQGRRDTITLHFAFNSHRIQPGDEAMMANAFRERSIDSIFITGYTDKVGTAGYNQLLSEERANAAAAYLRTNYSKHQLPKGKVTGRGIAPTPERSDSENRRVEIVCYSASPTAPPAASLSASPSASPAAPSPHPDTLNRYPGGAAPIRSTTDSIVVVKAPLPDDSAKPSAILFLRHINFIVDTPVPTDSTTRILPEFANELMQFKDHHLEIDGYVNSIVPLRGQKDPLFILSVRRAKFIYDYLVNAGFDPGKLTYKGMGNASPVNPHPMTTQEMN